MIDNACGRWSLALLLAFLTASLHSSAPNAQADVQFNRDIRPILSSNCFHCHGPDEADREADLRLDTQDGIQYAFGSELGESEGWLRITSTDPDMQMPPPDSHLELTAEQRATLAEWIRSGANWEGHWAFVTPTSPELPRVNRAWWPENPIDYFVLRRLEANHTGPAPPADRETLIRRVTFDLTGLPPTLEQVDQFLADRDSNAYENLVDRLLASEAFGERMAVAWLDAARYGDTSVFHADGRRDMWAWRDWVIRSFNQNLPYDQFTVHQLAGDLLPNATNETRLASGFNRNNATTDEGGAIAEEFRVEYAVDRVNTTATVWMALTLQCAQCHDHKYDPISQREYYQFYAYFNQAADPGMQTRNGNQSPVVNVYDPQRQTQIEGAKKSLAELKQQLDQHIIAAEEPFVAWLNDLESSNTATDALPDQATMHVTFEDQVTDGVFENVRQATTRTEAQPGTVYGEPTQTAGRVGRAISVDAKSFVEFPQASDFERDAAFSFSVWVYQKKLGGGALLSRMDDAGAHRGFDLLSTNQGQLQVHMVHKWPDNAVKVYTEQNDVLKPDRWQHVAVTYDGTSKASGVKIYVDGQLVNHKSERDSLSATIRTDQPLRLGRRSTGSTLTGTLDELRIYERALMPDEVLRLAAQGPLDDWLATPTDARTDEQRRQLKRHFLGLEDEAYRQLEKQITAQQDRMKELQEPLSTVMVMQDVETPRMTYMLNRGNYHSPMKDKPVEPTTLSMLPAMPEGAPSNRLGMAQWLVQPEHPLTARVAVNRYWQMLFGVGLVKTAEDFGSQGDWPSHPQLLDWLAVDFQTHGWDIKRTIKQMVMSSTYRQSSRIRNELRETDPNNRLLARAPRFRLQAEFVRDNALSVSGLLVKKVGGPSVKPYQPPGLWNEVSLDGNLRFKQDHGQALYRRSMYIYWRRSAPPPSMTLFDAPSREKCVIQRSRTNTPLQALVTLNDVQYVEAARALAERVIQEGGDTLEARLVYAFRCATGRYPSQAKLDVLRATYEEEHQQFAAAPDRAAAWLSHGESPRDESIDQIEHAAMTVVTSILLNLDETLTRG